MVKKSPPQTKFTARLRPEVAEVVAKAMEPGESASAFAAKALAFYALKRTTGKWPQKLPEDLQPRKAGRRWPKADD